MFAGIWKGRSGLSVLALLLLAFFLGYGYSGADDVDFPDILTPGGGGDGSSGGGGFGGGGSGGFLDVEVYLGEGVVFHGGASPEGCMGKDPDGKLPGLAIASVEGGASSGELPSKNKGIFYFSPNPKVVLLGAENGGAEVFPEGDTVVVQGAFTALLKKGSLEKKVILRLEKQKDTESAAALIRIGGPNAEGAFIVLPNDGHLSLSALLKAALKTGVTTFTVLQVEFDARGNLTNKTAVLVQCKDTPGNAIYWGGGYGDAAIQVETAAK